MEIRLATSEDLPAILAISNEAALHTAANFAIEPETLESWGAEYAATKELHPWFVAVDGGVVGIAKALYAQLLPTLTTQGYFCALGGITQPNAASVRLHESFGMKRVALFERVGWKFDAWHDVGYWQASLQSDATAKPREIRPVREVLSRRTAPST